MPNPSKTELLTSTPLSFDTGSLAFSGARGSAEQHLDRAELVTALRALPQAPLDVGHVELLVARGQSGERILHTEAQLTADGGMPGDRWVTEDKYGPAYQLATTRADTSRVVANGQPLELHGDNLFVDLDLSFENLPEGTELQAGGARLVVTPQEHNGCKKWVQRFGLASMRLNMDTDYRGMRLRGLYLRVVEKGVVRVGDEIRVLSRGSLS
jgi:hypothetical protein